MLRILLADDHAVVRQGVKQILAEAFAKATFGEAQNAHELLELVASERWDIVVLDLTMPGGSGLEALKYISALVADELVLHARHEDDQPLHKHLSDREYQVLCLIASGKEVKEISTELSLSAKTISTYRARLLEKMNMKTNAELTHYAIQNSLV